jgi:hypothetical protein
MAWGYFCPLIFCALAYLAIRVSPKGSDSFSYGAYALGAFALSLGTAGFCFLAAIGSAFDSLRRGEGSRQWHYATLTLSILPLGGVIWLMFLLSRQ